MGIFKRLLSKMQNPMKKALYSRMHPQGPEMYEQAGLTLKEYRGEALTKLVREYMTNSDEVLRSRASSLLVNFIEEGDKSVVPDLIRALRDNNESVQSKAAEGLGKSGAVEAIEPIINAVSIAYLRTYSAAEALKKIDPPIASAILRDKLDSDTVNKYEWATMLVSLQDTSAIPILKKYLNRGEFDAYDKRFIAKFVVDHPEVSTSEEKKTCIICQTELPVTKMKGAGDKWFCAYKCWKKRGTVLPTGIGTDCPLFHEGLCSAGDGESLCSLTQGHYDTDCHVYKIIK